MTAAHFSSNAEQASPSTGLGGPLWLFAGLLALLPAPLTAWCLASLWRDIRHLARDTYGLSTQITHWALQLVLLLALWRAAWLFFRRDPRFFRAWLVLILVLVVGLFALEWMPIVHYFEQGWSWSQFAEGPWRDRWLLACCAGATLYLALAAHPRRAFHGGTPPPWGPQWLPSMLRHGPADWSRGFWLIPGFLLFSALLHGIGVLALAPEASPFASGHGGVEAMAYRAQGAEAARVQWYIHLCATLLWPFACRAFVRRRPATLWWVSLLVGAMVAVPAVLVDMERPPMLLDGRAYATELAATLLMAAMVLAALARTRRRFSAARTTDAT